MLSANVWIIYYVSVYLAALLWKRLVSSNWNDVKLLYTYYDLFQATINIVFDRVGKVDPVTRGIEIAVNYLGIQFDVSCNFTFSHHFTD